MTLILWLELTPRSFVPLATLKSKVLPIQLAQDTDGSKKYCLWQAGGPIHEAAVKWVSGATRVLIENTFKILVLRAWNWIKVVRTFPFRVWFNPGCYKKVAFNFTFLGLLSLIINVPFCYEDGCGELWKLDILVVVY